MRIQYIGNLCVQTKIMIRTKRNYYVYELEIFKILEMTLKLKEKIELKFLI